MILVEREKVIWRIIGKSEKMKRENEINKIGKYLEWMLFFGEKLKIKGEMERKWNRAEKKKNMEKHREWNDGNWRGKNGIEEEKNETLEMKQKKSNWNLLVVQW